MRWTSVIARLQLLAIVAGCHRGNVATSTSTLAGARGELHQHGAYTIEAIVDTGDGGRRTTARVTLDDTVAISRATLRTTPSGARVPDWAPARVAVRDLFADCPTHAFADDPATRRDYPRCRLFTGHSSKVILGRRRVVPEGAVNAALVLGAAAGLATCAFACESPYAEISGGTLLVSAAVAAAGLAIVIAVAAAQVD